MALVSSAPPTNSKGMLSENGSKTSNTSDMPKP